MIGPLPRRRYIVPTTVVYVFALILACGFAILLHPALAAHVDRRPPPDQLEAVRSTLFNADVILLELDGHEADPAEVEREAVTRCL